MSAQMTIGSLFDGLSVTSRTDSHRLAAYIRQRREELGMTQVELGQRIGRSQRAVSNMEQNLSTLPDPELLHALSDALETPVLDLLRLAGYRFETNQSQPDYRANAETILRLVDDAWDLDPKARVAIKALVELGRR